MKVKEFCIGKTHIAIFDDAVVKTEEEVQEILKRCAAIVQSAWKDEEE